MNSDIEGGDFWVRRVDASPDVIVSISAQLRCGGELETFLFVTPQRSDSDTFTATATKIMKDNPSV
ncbi:MAG: hypothetical protein ACRCSP_08610, partial [Rhodoglobus sp.]